MATSKRYPLSTPEGNSIPLEVVKPLGLLRIPFTSAAYASVILASTFQDKIFIASSDVDCYVSIEQTPENVVDSVVSNDIIYIPAGTMIAFISNTLYLSARGVSASGTVHIQIIDTWAGLALETQISRR